MKLIAKRDLRNTLGDRVRIQGETKHPLQICRGTVFEIGTGEDIKKLPTEERQLVAQLFVTGSVAEANDPAAVKAIQEEIAVEEKREAARTKHLQAWAALPRR